MERTPEDLTEFEARLLRTVRGYRHTVHYVAVMVTVILILTVLERV